MEENETAKIIAHTQKWIIDVVIGCNFCPFAAKEIKKNSIYYQVLHNASLKTTLQAIAAMLLHLNSNPAIETSLLILPKKFLLFKDYLQLYYLAQQLLSTENYDGIYQIASFHPNYLFEGTTALDAANYTNCSPYPMLHFLREDSVTKAVDNYLDIDNISKKNIAFAKQKGLLFMQQMLINTAP